jgi:branched-chain amino acid transport system ATP-binding protein
VSTAGCRNNSNCSHPAPGRQAPAGGTAVLLVEQLIEKALALADPVYALARGSIVPEAKTGEADLPRRLEHAYLASASHRT